MLIYARVAVKTLIAKYLLQKQGLPTGGMKKVFEDFSKQFPAFIIDYKTARK